MGTQASSSVAIATSYREEDDGYIAKTPSWHFSLFFFSIFETCSDIIKLIRVAPNKIMKLTIFLFRIFEMFNLVSKFKIDLTNFEFSILFLCLARNCPRQIFIKCILGTSGTNWKIKNILFCQFERLH